METRDAIRSRRNVRECKDRPLPREHLERILEAGRRAPSAQNWQPWDAYWLRRECRVGSSAAAGDR
jgi:nitroreductase